MTESVNVELESYYEYVRREGRLRTLEHARNWSAGVLKSLGTNLDGATKKTLAKALPDELANQLKGVFWLLHFRDSGLTSYEFRRRVALRSGNTDPEFALFPTLAVMGGLREFTDAELEQKVADNLAPELRELWLAATPKSKVD